MSGRVVCLADGDDAGKTICRRLKDAGIEDDAILNLGRVGRGCTLEDLVKPDVFARAVNHEVETWGVGQWRC